VPVQPITISISGSGPVAEAMFFVDLPVMPPSRWRLDQWIARPSFSTYLSMPAKGALADIARIRRRKRYACSDVGPHDANKACAHMFVGITVGVIFENACDLSPS
jgi:hypothetical protein